jgi:hypothetical protein
MTRNFSNIRWGAGEAADRGGQAGAAPGCSRGAFRRLWSHAACMAFAPDSGLVGPQWADWAPSPPPPPPPNPNPPPHPPPQRRRHPPDRDRVWRQGAHLPRRPRHLRRPRAPRQGHRAHHVPGRRYGPHVPARRRGEGRRGPGPAASGAGAARGGMIVVSGRGLAPGTGSSQLAPALTPHPHAPQRKTWEMFGSRDKVRERGRGGGARAWSSRMRRRPRRAARAP